MGAVESEDADLEPGDEHDDSPAFVGGADGDVVELGVVADGDGAVGADAVVADAVVGVVVVVPWCCFGSGGVDDGGCGAVCQ